MNDVRARSAYDSRSSSVKPCDCGRGVGGTVYVVVAHPDDTRSFVVDVFGTRAAAETARAAVASGAAVEIVAHRFTLAPGDDTGVHGGDR